MSNVQTEKHEEKHDDEKDNKKHIDIVIDDKPYQAPQKKMTGSELRGLARPPVGADRDLFLVVSGPKDDEKIADDQVVHLKDGMQFYSAPKTINPGDAAHLPDADEAYLLEKGFKWSMPAPGFLVLAGVAVSNALFDRAVVDLMIVIPAGYPMAALDMFYVSPELKLKGGGYPKAAEVFQEHCGRRWQRFSRHFNVAPNLWQPGIDSLKSFLAVVLAELQGKA